MESYPNPISRCFVKNEVLYVDIREKIIFDYLMQEYSRMTRNTFPPYQKTEVEGAPYATVDLIHLSNRAVYEIGRVFGCCLYFFAQREMEETIRILESHGLKR